MVVIESTVAPGTTGNVVKPILERKSGMKAGDEFGLAYSYERVMPGKLIDYIQNMSRIVGGINRDSELRAVEMYKKIVNEKIYSTDILSAETAKTMENAYRDVNIAFANEMALVAENLGVDIWEIRELINSRSQRDMHMPGSGVGGHCLPKDTWLLRYGLNEYGIEKMDTNFICLARTVNEFMPIHMANMIQESLDKFGRKPKDSKVAVLGVAYLEDSDDTRNTPAYALINELEREGTEVIAHDPYVRVFPEADLTDNLEEAVKGADAIAIVTKHSQYFKLDLAKIKELMRTPVIADGRNVIEKSEAENAGFTYRGIGKGKN
jgi:UDP-N-acetyl-D-mannosaminuronic acid dehydrogenase